MTGIKKINLISAVLVSLSLCGGCTLEKAGNSSQDQAVQEDNETEQVKTEKAEKEEINEMHLRDKDSLYENADDTSVVTMYLTVSKGNSSENTYHTWKEINSYSVYDYEDMGVERYQVAGLLQVGDENGPIEGEVGYGESVPNATVQIRGQTSSQNAQKNYKIELKKNKGTWRGQRTINLNKHMTEGMRFRNKLAYDLIRGIPQMVGLRTQFVHLYVKDNTEESDGKFEDYGIYTQVEQLNKTALKSHGLDSNGQLYKINSFEFYRYEDIIKKEDDAGYDKTAFEKMLEINAVCYSGQMYNNLASQSLFIPLKRVYTSYQTVRQFRFHTSKGPVLPFRQIFLCPVSFCCKTCRRSKSVVLPRFPA